ncbi:MAG: DUF1415 domain-containing protein [Planctomycetaceae bacterium]|jgi:hypothetical protein
MSDRSLPIEPADGPERVLVRQWLEQVVVGLNLCPFARGPWTRGEIRVVVCRATDNTGILDFLAVELRQLADRPRREVETTVIILAAALPDFLDYNDFLELAEERLCAEGWEGVFQLASFHPAYRFADTEPDDPGNLTNRAPYPLLHLLREESVSEAVDATPDPDEIPRRNIARMEGLTQAERQALFPWLSATGPGR